MKNSLDELHKLFDEIGYPTKRCPDCKPDEDGGYGGPCATCDRMRAVPDYEAWTEKLLFECDDLRKQLAAHTDPSPEAQLRRYREAQALVENPPKVALEVSDANDIYWVPLGSRYVHELAQIVPPEGRKTRWTANVEKVKGTHYFDDEEDAFKFVEDNLKAAGWELVGGAE